MHFGGAQRGACNFSIHPRPNGFCAPLRAHNQFRGPAGLGATRGRQPPRAWLAGLRGSRQAFSGNSRMERLGARDGRAGFPRLEGRARKRVLPVRDGNLDSPAIGGLRGLSRAGRQAQVHSRPGGLPAGLAPGFGTALCWQGEVGPRAGAGGSRRWVPRPFLGFDGDTPIPPPSGASLAGNWQRPSRRAWWPPFCFPW